MNVRRFVGIITTQLYFIYYINTGKLLFKIQGLFKDHTLKFQGPYLLLFTLRFDINYQNILIIMDLFFLMATIFYENSFVIAYQRITFRNEQDNNSDDASYQMFFD